MSRFCVVILAAALSAGCAWAGDAARGGALAGEHCARCHDIGADGPPKRHPPSFAAIAGFRPEEQIEARIWTPNVHSAMPSWSYVLTREDVDDLVTYIVSLE